MTDYVTRDSGQKQVHASGMQRDTQENKPAYHLMLPEGVPYEEQLLYRVAMLYRRGGDKYGDRNWEQSCTPDDLSHHIGALLRHVFKFACGVEDGEDHGAAVVWNVSAVDLTRRNIRLRDEENSHVTKR